ncbi:MAG TPA: hypothetical protein VNU00_08465, partial [Candidatus Binataceae bacterium]|nr:hypothetical protein [Candidatus Binataceae bacterium]
MGNVGQLRNTLMRVMTARAIGLGFFALLAAIFFTAADAIAQNVMYGGQMALEWTTDTFSCPGGGFYCPGQPLVETVTSESDITPLSADYSSCSISPVGSGPTIAPVGVGVGLYPLLQIVFIVPSSTWTNTCGFSLFRPSPGYFWYTGKIGNIPVSLAPIPGLEFLPPSGQFDVLSWDSTNTYPTDLTFNATGSNLICNGPGSGCPNGYGYSQNAWSFNGQLSACSVVYNGTLNGNLIISNGLTCIINGMVTGNVKQVGGSLFASNATIGGNLEISFGGEFTIENTAVTGNVHINGNPAGSMQDEICATNVGGNIQVNNNTAAITIGTSSA